MAAVQTETSSKVSTGFPRAARYAVMPVILAGACVALYLWIGTLELDSIEQRSLNAENITRLLIEHIQLSFAATAIVTVLAVSTGVLLTRPLARRVAPFLVNVANIGQAVPSIGVLVLLALLIGIGPTTALIALVAYAFLPILRNTMVGLQQVDRSVIESARGMGMTKAATLFKIELPLAIPIMVAGIRTALVITVGTVTLATFIDAGGLGDLISVGISLSRNPILVTGAALTAVLALFIDWLAGIAEDVLRPKGL